MFFVIWHFNQCWLMKNVCTLNAVLTFQIFTAMFFTFMQTRAYQKSTKSKGLILRAHCKESIVYFMRTDFFLSWLICLYFLDLEKLELCLFDVI